MDEKANVRKALTKALEARAGIVALPGIEELKLCEGKTVFSPRWASFRELLQVFVSITKDNLSALDFQDRHIAALAVIFLGELSVIERLLEDYKALLEHERVDSALAAPEKKRQLARQIAEEQLRVGGQFQAFCLLAGIQ